ncbi:hypothetical protein HG535_0G04390 [Zygotorulaspora mrakii]|uniref:Large ribosomal subunit protein bL34m n=1 Tax=Zygotorulaspora mrakii TaxID=42260 RepID=A0A7H9B865_ZYGMR|nr:uncharacterized protein HG535_0G04390 [Zygotorulaspora mrakii]QLG74556.1 hypothetical protein HG535_0G04390 [Zygotorulaspora mrakii]
MMMSLLYKPFIHQNSRRTFTSLSSFSPLRTLLPQNHAQRLIGLPHNQLQSGQSILHQISFPFGLNIQRRWKSRGNTFQPSTLKRKRRIGFLARARSKQGSKILQRRKAKGRWYLTH